MQKSADSPWTPDRALALGHDEQLQLFATLPAPDFLELTGEYRGHASTPRSEKAAAAQNAALFNEQSPFGFWLGKAFKATSATGGEGYNHCRKNGEVVRHLRFGTRM